MGTNYYAGSEPCPHCHRVDTAVHIGKSSAGWQFLFRADEERGLTTWQAWRAWLSKPGVLIEDEYGAAHSVEALEALIAAKADGRGSAQDRVDPDGYRFSIHPDFS